MRSPARPRLGQSVSRAARRAMSDACGRRRCGGLVQRIERRRSRQPRGWIGRDLGGWDANPTAHRPPSGPSPARPARRGPFLDILRCPGDRTQPLSACSVAVALLRSARSSCGPARYGSTPSDRPVGGLSRQKGEPMPRLVTRRRDACRCVGAAAVIGGGSARHLGRLFANARERPRQMRPATRCGLMLRPG